MNEATVMTNKNEFASHGGCDQYELFEVVNVFVGLGCDGIYIFHEMNLDLK